MIVYFQQEMCCIPLCLSPIYLEKIYHFCFKYGNCTYALWLWGEYY